MRSDREPNRIYSLAACAVRSCINSYAREVKSLAANTTSMETSYYPAITMLLEKLLDIPAAEGEDDKNAYADLLEVGEDWLAVDAEA